MWSRSPLASALAIIAVVALALPALAGGWAVTTIDSLPDGGFRAGETYRLGYMIRQHGDKPFGGARTEIRVRSSATGEVHVFPGAPDGPVGHYVAEVRFPAAGEWTWDVTQEPFAPQALGALVVAPSPTAEPARPALAVLWLALPLATALGLFAHRLFVFARHRRPVPEVRVSRVAGGSE